jgi:lincosamide nucleotidyltransferase A/C/D/E
VTAEDALFLYQLLLANAVPAWLVGGWGIDALLGEQTREHKDLDILVLVDDVGRLLALLEREGCRFAYLWEENRAVDDRKGNPAATAFVCKDDGTREIDAHAMWLDELGNGIPAWVMEEGFRFRREDLAGQGWIMGVEVRCISPRMQAALHTGYPLPETQVGDMLRLRAKFGTLEGG